MSQSTFPSSASACYDTRKGGRERAISDAAQNDRIEIPSAIGAGDASARTVAALILYSREYKSIISDPASIPALSARIDPNCSTFDGLLINGK